LYKQEEITIKELFEKKLTKENSIKALRTRADEKILAFIGLKEDGRTRLYDKQLSVVRVNAARNCKNHEPAITWGTFKRTHEVLDSKNPSLNNMVIDLLNKDNSEQKAVKQVEAVLLDHLRKNGHLG